MLALGLAAVVGAMMLLVTAGGSASARPFCGGDDPPPICDGPPDEPPPSPPAPPVVDTASFFWQLEQLTTGSSGAVREADLDHAAVASRSIVTLNGCASESAHRPVSYLWTFSNGDAPIRSSSCQVNWLRPLSHTATATVVTLTLQPTGAAPVSVSRSVPFRDVLIASIGDSAASGEGAPDNPGAKPAWVSADCDRSGWSANAQAALKAQRALPNTTVHFWDISCSGAAITAGISRSLDDGGLLDPYNGVHHRKGLVLPPQLLRLQQLRGQAAGLPIDRLLMTVGANDTDWSGTAVTCMQFGLGNYAGIPAQELCLKKHQAGIRAAVAQLPSHFDKLGAALPFVVPASNIYLSEYYDPLDSLSPQPLQCSGDRLAGLYLRSWAVAVVENPLQSIVAGKAHHYGWHLVTGIRQAFQGHGTCRHAADRWVNDVDDSPRVQHDRDGTWHPNRKGQQAIATIAYQKFAPGL